MSVRVYAKINKETLRFIRNMKQVSFDYIERNANFSEARISIWEDISSGQLPTINQAKELAKCYRVPFAGFYMNSSDININHLPVLINRRTMIGTTGDDSAVNLAIIDLLNDREFYIATKAFLKETIPVFTLSISNELPALEWARIIRDYFNISLAEQYRTPSKRQFYLYLREKIESKGIFVQGFQKVDVGTLRGMAVVDDLVPIIGINDADRYPAKSFTIIHELVHVIKRASALCNDMEGFTPWDSEEHFCNAVAGEVLVPKAALLSHCKNINVFTIEEVDNIAKKFSVSSEVIARRLYDVDKCGKAWYIRISDELNRRFYTDRENQREAVKLGLSDGLKRNMSREAIDRTSSSMCDALLKGYTEGIFDKSDVSVHIGIGIKHVDKFLTEVSGWYR